MKNHLFCAIAAVLATVTCAFATTDITTSTTIGGGTFTPSNKVGIKIISTTTSYAGTSAHLSGTFEYGTVGGAGVTGDPSKILKKAWAAASGATIGVPTAPASATALADGFAE